MCMYLITAHTNVARVAVRAVTIGAFAPVDLSVAAEPATRLQVYPCGALHEAASMFFAQSNENHI